MDDELEEIKKRKLMELQAGQREALQQQLGEQQKAGEEVTQLESLVKQFLTREALQRYGNLKIAHTEKAIKVLVILGQMIQTGQIRSRINDTLFKEILRKLEPPKKEFTIKRK